MYEQKSCKTALKAARFHCQHKGYVTADIRLWY